MNFKSVLVYCNDTYETPELIASVSLLPEQTGCGEVLDLARAQTLYNELASRAVVPTYVSELRLLYLKDGIPTCLQRWSVVQNTDTCEGVLSEPFLRDLSELPTLML